VKSWGELHDEVRAIITKSKNVSRAHNQRASGKKIIMIIGVNNRINTKTKVVSLKHSCVTFQMRIHITLVTISGISNVIIV